MINHRKETEEGDISPLFDYSYSHRLEKSNYFILGLTGMYLLVSLFAIYHHEMWRDEMQAWLLARDSSNLLDLLRHLKYEGHPALWHLILMPVTRLSESPIGMQVTHLVIATTTVFLIVKYSPFTPFQKFFFVFGYYPLYEYNVVCRNYAIGLLLVVVLCILLEQRYKSPVRVAITLFLLSHTSVYALILVIGTTIGLGVDYLLNSQRTSSRGIYIGFSLIIIGIVTAIIQLKPPSDTGFAVGWYFKFDLERVYRTLHLVSRAFFPIPNEGIHFWGTELLMKFGWFQKYKLIIAILIIGVTTVITLSRPTALLVYISSTTGLLVFFYIKYQGSIRHHGFLFITFLLTVWGGRSFKSYFRWPYFFESYARASLNLLLTGLLLMHAMGGLRAVANDVKYPFSYSKLTAEFIKAQKLDKIPILGDVDFAVSTVVGYLEKESVYYARGDRKGSFVRWDNRRTHGVSNQQVLEKAKQVSIESQSDVLLILNYSLPTEETIKKHRVDKLVEFTGSTIGDEGFYLYRYRTQP